MIGNDEDIHAVLVILSILRNDILEKHNSRTLPQNENSHSDNWHMAWRLISFSPITCLASFLVNEVDMVVERLVDLRGGHILMSKNRRFSNVTTELIFQNYQVVT